MTREAWTITEIGVLFFALAYAWMALTLWFFEAIDAEDDEEESGEPEPPLLEDPRRI